MDIWRFTFMKQALLAVLLVSPLFALLGTMVVSKRLAFFSDVLGHSALTGVAIGVLLGWADPQFSILFFAVALAVCVNVLRLATNAASDTVLGVFFAVVVAIGVVILSAGSGFARYTGYLIGDILAVTPAQLGWLAACAVAVLAYWIFLGNALLLTGVDKSLARSRGVRVFLVETGFCVLLAVVVTFSIRLVGILIINSLLILPAAAARNLASNTRAYTALAVTFSIFSGICGLAASYYWGTASGATIVLFAAFIYALSAIVSLRRRRKPVF